MTRSTTRAARLGLAAALAAAAACASMDATAPGPPPFLGVKKLVLVRRVHDGRPQRPRDAIDALKESLDARGYAVRIVELGPGKDGELRDLERLQDRLEARLWGRAGATPRAGGMGNEAGAVVARLGADAVAGYHRLDLALAPLPPPQDPWGSAYAQRPAAPARRPAGALSLVAADGAVGWFPWGGPGAELDPGALVNAAEAIDALLAALAGDAGEGG